MGGCQTEGTSMPPIHLDTPICLDTPLYVQMPPDICMPHTPLYICMFSPYDMGMGDISTPNMFLGLWGHQHISQAFWYLSVHPFVSQFITFMSVAPHYCGLFIYWTGCLWMFVMLHAVVPFFVVFIISQAATTMAMNTTPLVTVVSSGISSFLSMVTMVPSLMGLPATSGQHDMVLPPPLTPRHSGSVVGLATVPQQ